MIWIIFKFLFSLNLFSTPAWEFVQVLNGSVYECVYTWFVCVRVKEMEGREAWWKRDAGKVNKIEENDYDFSFV